LIADHEKGGTPTLLDYLSVLRRWKWTFLYAAVLVPAVAVFVSLRQAPAYEASAKILLNRQNVTESLTGLPTPYVDPARTAQTEAELARVPAVARRAIAAARVRNLTPSELLDSSSVTASASSDFVRFSVTRPDPAIARRLATAYARAYTSYRRNLETKEFARAQAAVRSRIERLETAGLKGSAVYRSLVQKERQLTALEALRTSSAVVVEEPDRTTKVGPRTIRNGTIGLALGLVLGLVLAFLRDAVDTRVRSVERIRNVLGLRLLGSLPAPPRKLQKEHRLAMMAAPMSHDAELFRSLRASLDFANVDSRARTIMVTSAVEGEGKTTTVANLAVALARAGRRVVLIDFDLRDPRLHRLFNLEEGPGLIDVELGDAQLEEALRPIPLTGGAENGLRTRREGKLEVLPAGQMLQGPDWAALAVARMLEGVQDRADLVLIDAAPLLPVGDAIALSAYVDGLILVLRLNALRSSELEELRRILSSSPAAKLGFVLTGVPRGDAYKQSYRYRTPERREEVQVPMALGSPRAATGPQGESSGRQTRPVGQPSPTRAADR
jgi:succinoglycan biosynthesis transport protein ExoP